MIVTILKLYKETVMACQEIERLKRDRNETLHYRIRLLKKGKSDLAYKMQRKADYITETIRYLQTAT